MKERVHALDLAKGLAMLLVFWDHTHTDIWTSRGGAMLDMIEVSLFFILAGLTWKDNVMLGSWLKHKAQRLIIPCLVFLALGVLVYLGVRGAEYSPRQMMYEFATGEANPPLWFLRALVWALALYWLSACAWRYNIYMRGGLTVMIAIAGWWLSGMIHTHEGSGLMFWLLQSGLVQGMICLPLIWVGDYLSFRHPIGGELKWDTVTCVALGVCVTAWVMGAQAGLHLDQATAPDAWWFYIAAIAGGVTVLIFCYVIKQVPWVNFIGRYSLIFLGIQFPVIVILQAMGLGHGWEQWLVAVAVSTALCYPVRKLFN